MPLPASLIASIISAIIETASQYPAANTTQYDMYTTTRPLPPEAKQGVMLPPPCDGTAVSYTHLDVYKGQEHTRLLNALGQARFQRRHQKDLPLPEMSLVIKREMVVAMGDADALARFDADNATALKAEIEAREKCLRCLLYTSRCV